jgi:hypothetical protein
MKHSFSDIASRLCYVPETGDLIWKTSKNPGKSKVGQSLRYVDPLGYIAVQIDKVKYRGHRLAWLLYYGEWPDKFVDHINRNRSDNRISNLRLVTSTEHAHNCEKQRNNTSGYRGVSVHNQSGKWQVQIGRNGKKLCLGLFATPKDAALAYDREAISQGRPNSTLNFPR